MAIRQKEKEAKAAEDKKNEPAEPKEKVFDPNADLKKMSFPEQLAWNKIKMALA